MLNVSYDGGSLNQSSSTQSKYHFEELSIELSGPLNAYSLENVQSYNAILFTIIDHMENYRTNSPL